MLLLLQLALLLSSPANAAVGTFAFQPHACAYALNFPAPFSSAEDPRYRVAEIERDNLRLSAICITAPVEKASTTQESAVSRLGAISAAMGLRHAEVVALPQPDCAEARATFDNDKPYQIAARACFDSKSTFIAEAVFRPSDSGGLERQFLNSIVHR